MSFCNSLYNHLYKANEELHAVEHDDRAADHVDDAQHLVVESGAEQGENG